MAELRWNPILREWVITAAHRQKRTFKPPENYCPLCPTEEEGFPTEVPANDYDMVVFENKFPSLLPDPPSPEVEDSGFYRTEKSRGICEVILFTSDHHGVMSQKPLSRFIKLIKVWRDRYQELSALEYIDYVFIFENRGEEVGVTLNHPHGQIYAYPFIPPLIERELESSLDYYRRENNCLFCRVVKEEVEVQKRIVADNDSFTAFVPFFARYPYEVNIYARRHLPSLQDFTEREERDLAALLKIIISKYDNLFGFVFPYVMAVHQKPSDGTGKEYSHFHIEFYPPYRTENKLKYLAGSESGAGTFINDSPAEIKAEELRETKPFAE